MLLTFRQQGFLKPAMLLEQAFPRDLSGPELMLSLDLSWPQGTCPCSREKPLQHDCLGLSMSSNWKSKEKCSSFWAGSGETLELCLGPGLAHCDFSSTLSCSCPLRLQEWQTRAELSLLSPSLITKNIHKSSYSWSTYYMQSTVFKKCHRFITDRKGSRERDNNQYGWSTWSHT